MYLQNHINADSHENSLYANEQRYSTYKSSNRIKHLDALEVDQLFYKQLPKYLVKQLYDKIYEPDFQMLGYEYPQKYIDMGYADDVE